MARPAKPTHLKVLHGDQPSRINTQEPQPAVDPVRCPAWMSSKAKAMWRELAPDLAGKGVLTAWDRHAFAACCEAYVTWRVAQEDVDARGVLVSTKNGTVKNPALQVARDAMATFVSLASRFGLTPSDRSKLTVGEERVDAGERLLS